MKLLLINTQSLTTSPCLFDGRAGVVKQNEVTA